MDEDHKHANFPKSQAQKKTKKKNENCLKRN